MKYKELSPDEQKYYDLYKSNSECFAYKINDALRKGDGIENFGAEIVQLDSICKKDIMNDDTILYRATFDRIVSQFVKGKEYRNPDYLSTTSKASAVQIHFTITEDPVYIRFVNLKGIRFGSLEENESFDDTEKEVLLEMA